MEKKIYKALKVVLVLGFASIFTFQAYKEIYKYYKQITSVTIRTEDSHSSQDEEHPDIVICMKKPFKLGTPARTLEEYNASTYSLDEILDLSPEYLISDLNVTEIATWYYGRCALMKAPKDASNEYTIEVTLNTQQEVVLHFIDKGQELCMIYGRCDEFVSTATLRSNVSVVIVRVKVKKKILPDR